MKNKLTKALSLLLSLVVTLTVLMPVMSTTVFAINYVELESVNNPDLKIFVHRNEVSGDMFTDSKLFATKLNQAFDGDLGVTWGGKKALLPVGSYEVPVGRTLYFTERNSGTSNSGESCYAYANAFYNFLFGDTGRNGQGPYKASTKKPYSGEISKAKFVEYGITIGTYAKLINYVGGQHYIIILKYDDNGLWFVDGNGMEVKKNDKGKKHGGQISVNYRSWKKFTEKNVKSPGDSIGFQRISFVVIPKAEALEKYDTTGLFNVKKLDKKITITAIAEHYQKKLPYKDKLNVKPMKIGDSVTIDAQYTNLNNNLWYRTDTGSWVYSGHYSALPQKTVTFCGTNSANKSSTKKKVKNLPKPTIVKEDQPYTVPLTIPELDGYKFLGWATSEKATTVKYHPGDVINEKENIKLFPVWKQTKTTMELEKSQVSFDLTGRDTATSDVSFECKGDLDKANENVVIKSDNDSVATATCRDIQKKGVLLWDSISGKVRITAKKPGVANIRVEIMDKSKNLLISKSIRVEVTETYKVEFYEGVGGTVSKTQTKKYNKDLTLLEYIPEKANHFFMGWSTDNTNNVAYLPGQEYRANQALKLYAVWEANNFIDYSFSNGVLTITGKGNMPSFPTGKTPWVLGTNGTVVDPDSVKEIFIGEGVTSIGVNAFADYKNLELVVMISVKSICNKAFYNCTNLGGVESGIQATYVGTRAFSGCSNLRIVESVLLYGGAKSTRAAAAVESDTEIGAFAFENCTSLASVNLPETISRVGVGAFSGCSAVTEVNLPSSIEEIPDTAFFGCSNLQEINIPENIDIIGDGAFSGCSAAETITIPEGVEIIGDQAFSGCSAVTAVTIPESADEIGAGLFTNCTALSDVTLPENMEYIGDAMFSGCSALEAIEIPESVENIGDGAFGYCSSLESVNIPENVSVISNSSFTGCNALEAIDIPESVVTIGDYAFSSCSNLASVSMGEGTTTIGVGAFSFCSALETIDFPASVSLIDEGAFMGCSSLTNIEFMDSELSIEKLAFSGCSALSNVELPEEIIYVGEDAFASCSDDMNIVCFTSSSVYDGLALESTNITPIIPVTGVTISQTSANMNAGKTLTLGAQAVPANATCPNIIWSSNNPSVATVDENGVVTAVRGGEATITATTQDNAFVAECVVNVVVPVEGIEMLNSELEAYSIDEFMLSYTFTPANPSNIDVEWSSSNEEVATVSEDGTVTIHKGGEAIITVTTDDGGFTSSCKITATDYVPVEAVEFENANITLYTGDTTTLSPRAVPENATETYLELYIDETDVISLDEDGVVTALKPGTAKVYATSFDGIEGYCTITVKDKAEMGIQSIAVESKPSKTSFRYKENAPMSLDGLKLKVTYADGSSDIISDTSKMNVSGFSTNEQGEHTASVEYYGKTASFTYSVNFVWWQWIIRILLLGFLWY